MTDAVVRCWSSSSSSLSVTASRAVITTFASTDAWPVTDISAPIRVARLRPEHHLIAG